MGSYARAVNVQWKVHALQVLATEALKVLNINAYHGESHGLHNVSFVLEEGHVLAKPQERLQAFFSHSAMLSDISVS